MFSGLIVHGGIVAALVPGAHDGGMALTVEAAAAIADGVVLGDSIAINGVCLTVVACDDRTVRFDVVPETMQRTALRDMRAGERVNVELSLRLGDRLGGHLVYGHVDAAAEVLSKREEGQGSRITVALPAALAGLVVEKGYVALDGVSLTVAAVADGRFEVALIPETLRRTTLGAKAAGDLVNLEADPLARYTRAALDAFSRSR
ncbi:MAG: riboflavin synthase [Candidatus Eremiobacteraeota bacterium]|nr:riboflavin synthase [Candidatus Eremiobacteraeota bacterium]